ncbi:MAG: 3-phosphoshikimate 1-carboxyvinyltransferase [Flavobacteriia bacterium]
MDINIYPSSEIKGEITIPASKSVSQRALACALIVKGKTKIYNLGESEDELAALDILRQTGAVINKFENCTEIISSGIEKLENLKVNCNESGLSSRMFTPLLSNSKKQVLLKGEGSLVKRPMHFFDALMKELNVKFISNEGKLPFHINGPLIPKDIELDGSLSSQFITGVIYGYVASPYLTNEKITILNPTSIPYIELSLTVLKEFGVDLKLENNQIKFNGPYQLKETEINIEGDWSSASFFLVLAAINGELKINNLNSNSNQADIAILKALKDYGAQIDQQENSVFIRKNKANPFVFDSTHCPDLFPPLAVLACFANGTSTIKGVHRLFAKESNRAIAIQEELGKMGAKITIENDEMHIEPIFYAKPAIINPHGDHRIAMAAAILGSRATKYISIENAKVVNKSFPSFYKLLKNVKEDNFFSIH